MNTSFGGPEQMRDELSKDRSDVSKTSSRTRSRISNGLTAFLENVDGRSALGRRYRDILADLTSSSEKEPSAAKAIICRRAVTLVVWCEQVEARMGEGEHVDIVEFATAVNVLRLLLRDIALGATG